MKAREAGLESATLGDDIRKCYPLVSQSGSDSATLDNAVELLVMGGRSLAHAMMVLVPEAWAGNALMDGARRAFYEYNACVMEPWDGPSAIAFTDGVQIGATLDRNGLRPARYTVTHDGLVVLASETGTIEFDPERVKERGRLQPGRIFLVDTEKGAVISDDEVKAEICAAHPYGAWLKEGRIELKDIPDPLETHRPEHLSVRARQRAFGYTSEEVKLLIAPLARLGEEALGSMGTDTPLAILSHRPVPLYAYFKQLFAQVTNPPIDPIREELVMSLADYIGKDGSLLEDAAENARQIRLSTPVLTSAALEKLRWLSDEKGDLLRAQTLPAIFRADRPDGELERAVERLCRQASEALERGVGAIVLSDRDAGPEYAPIPSLLAVSAVHHHLIREGTRCKVALICESGDAREVHHVACLLGYGASAVNPYLIFDTVDDLILQGILTDLAPGAAQKNIVKALNKGLLKVMSKMGISTVQSYRGAQIFEAVGVSSSMIERYFTGTAGRIEGLGIADLEREIRRLHTLAWPKDELPGAFALEPGGEYQWRRFGEYHAVSPEMVESLQKAVRDDSAESGWETFRQFADAANVSGERAATLRGLMSFQPVGDPIPLESVEPAAEIVKRFVTGAMSLGSISRESHEGLAVAMNRIGGKSNTGEGGEDPARYSDERRSAIKQVASGRFGVTTHYLVNADELQIKMAQGAKPGEGGQLPGSKVSEYIAEVRHTTPGVTLISPPPHHDIYSIEDLAQLIFDLKNVNPKARISVKLVAEVGVGTVAAGVAKAHADHILISGYEGGTGASPVSSIKHTGVPWELGLAETQQVLVANGLRGRVTIQADGQMKTGRDIAVAALLGAEEFGFSTAPLVAQGCIMMRVCHLGTCPVGIATQDPVLRARFAGKPEHVINFFFFVAEDLRRIMAQLGFKTVAEMVGRADCLDASEAVRHWKSRGVELDRILAPSKIHPTDVIFLHRGAGPRTARGAGLPAHRRCQARTGGRPPRALRRAHPERQPNLRRDALGGDRASLRSGGPPRRHDSDRFHRGRGAELRRVSGAGADAHSLRGGQRLPRQGDERREDRALSHRRHDVRPGGEHHRGQYAPLRRDGRRGVSLGDRGRAVRGSKLRRGGGRGGLRRPRLRVHDGRNRRRAGQNRPQLRRGNERRRGLCLGPRRHARRPDQPRPEPSFRKSGDRDRRSDAYGAAPGPRRVHRQRPGPGDSERLGRRPAEVREDHRCGIQAPARKPARRRLSRPNPENGVNHGHRSSRARSDHRRSRTHRWKSRDRQRKDRTIHADRRRAAFRRRRDFRFVARICAPAGNGSCGSR